MVFEPWYRVSVCATSQSTLLAELGRFSLAEDQIRARGKQAAYAGWPVPSSASMWHPTAAARLARWADQSGSDSSLITEYPHAFR